MALETITPNSAEEEWQREVTEQLFRMQHALSEATATGAIIGNHHEGRAAEQMGEWLEAEARKAAHGRSLRLALGKGAVLVGLEEVTTPNSFDRGRYTVVPHEPKPDASEVIVDTVALVSLAATDEKAASMAYYLHDQPTGDWVRVRDAGKHLNEQVTFVNSAARQQALDVPTGADQWVPDFDELPSRDRDAAMSS